MSIFNLGDQEYFFEALWDDLTCLVMTETNLLIQEENFDQEKLLGQFLGDEEQLTALMREGSRIPIRQYCGLDLNDHTTGPKLNPIPKVSFVDDSSDSYIMKSKSPDHFLLFLRSTYLEPGIVSFNPQSRQNEELQDFLHTVDLLENNLRYTVSENVVYLREYVNVAKICQNKNLNVFIDLKWQVVYTLKNMKLDNLEEFYIPWVGRYSQENGFDVESSESQDEVAFWMWIPNSEKKSQLKRDLGFLVCVL